MSERLERVTHAASAPALELVQGVSVIFFANEDLGAKGFSTGLARFKPGGQLPCHKHGCGESITVLQGRCDITVEGRTYWLAPYDSLHVPAGVAHGMKSLEPSNELLAHVAFSSATVTREKARVTIAGTATTTLELSCGRCLEGFALPVTAQFDLRYLPAADAPPGGDEVEVADEDINTAYYRDGQIDLGELIHEQLYLALPMKPLCKDECLGLCPVCGANRNTTPCSRSGRFHSTGTSRGRGGSNC